MRNRSRFSAAHLDVCQIRDPTDNRSGDGLVGSRGKGLRGCFHTLPVGQLLGFERICKGRDCTDGRFR